MKKYIGMDVHCKKTAFVAQTESGEVVAEGEVETSREGFERMIGDVHAEPGTQVGLESGVQATWVSRILRELGMEPMVVNAYEVRAKARRQNQKSDHRDAFEICDGVRRGLYVSIVYVPPQEVDALRRVLSRRRHFVRVSTSQVNAAKYVLRAVGLHGEAATLTTEGAWKTLLDRPGVSALRGHIEMHSNMWNVAREHIRKLEKELLEAVQPFKETVDRLRTVPGGGPITAATYVAVLGTPRRFPDSRHVVSYIGFAPSTYDSGDRERHGHITKRGAGELRAVLCEAAHHAAKATHPLNPYFVRLAARQGYRKAIVAVAQRLARILYRMWRNEEEFDVSKLNVVPGVHTRTRTYYYSLRKPKEHSAEHCAGRS